MDGRFGFGSGSSDLDIVGTSVAMTRLRSLAERVGRTGVTTLILGESGTGKELVARAIHRHGRRANGPFIGINCSAVPDTLFEAEFFGYARGAFTDARRAYPGKFEQAEGGVLFLDEIGDMPMSAQAKLLRVLQERQVTRLGDRTCTKVDVQVVAASNVNLEVAVQERRFRGDLFWRLNVVPLFVPPLRERVEDLPALAEALLGRLASELAVVPRPLSPEALGQLRAYAWPGNVRELENALRGALVECDSSSIDVNHLPARIQRDGPASRNETSESLADCVQNAAAQIERSMILSALSRCRGARGEAARQLGIDRKTLFRKLRAYKIVTGC